MVFAKEAKWAKVWRRSLPKLLEELQFHDYWQKRVRVWKRIYDSWSMEAPHDDFSFEFHKYRTVFTYLKLRKMCIFWYYDYYGLPFGVRLPFLMQQFVRGFRWGYDASAVYSRSSWHAFYQKTNNTIRKRVTIQRYDEKGT